MADRLGKSFDPVARMIRWHSAWRAFQQPPGSYPLLPAVARRTARRRSARVCPLLILFIFNSHAHAIFQRVSIGLANIGKLIFRAKVELPRAALLEWGQTVRGAAIWHHCVTERQEPVASGQRKSFLRDSPGLNGESDGRALCNASRFRWMSAGTV